MEPTGKRLGPDLPANGVQALRDLITESRALREGIDHDREMWRARVRMNAVLMVVVLLAIGGLATIVVQFEMDRRQRSSINSELIRQNARTSELIADCTTEGGDCYRKGQARSATAVQGAIRGYLAVAQCQRVTDTDAELERCVARKLAAATPAPSPTP